MVGKAKRGHATIAAIAAAIWRQPCRATQSRGHGALCAFAQPMHCADFSRFDERPRSFSQSIQNSQLCCKAKRGITDTSGSLASKDFGNVRITCLIVSHDYAVIILQRIFNAGLGTKRKPVVHETVSEQNFFQSG